jgi:hypothetical protein
MMRITLISCFLFVAANSFAQSNNDWFVFKPTEVKAGNAIDMSSWLDKPAGRHGFLQMKEDDFVFEDGTPVKFWGVNIASEKPFVENSKATAWTKFMVAYGINAVRFHKFTRDATDGVHSTQLTDANWKNFDFFCNELRQAGIYYSWSHIYGHRLMPADSARVIAYNEIANAKFPWSHLNGTTVSLVNYAEDLQAINIELTINMLNHINPLTGLRYADDPALSFIELQNEDNIFWGAIEETLKQTPTYRALLCKKFSQWLKNKYGNRENLFKAWNNRGLPDGESLEKENIYPRPNHGYFTNESELAAKASKNVPQDVADRAAFLYEEQIKFYNRFIKAIRETGYKGVVVGSCWQAGSGLTHFYNLHADYVAGAVDRHNYSGGATGHPFVPGKVDNAAMVSSPGSGLLSTGFQQVAGRPFQISEWMALIPNQWTAESSPIIAVYGMGLQGWDASYAFAMDYDRFTPTIQSGHGVYNVTSPTQLALYPALSAMIYRNDVKEGEVAFQRNVSISDLQKGKLTVMEKTAQQYDVKSFDTQAPEQVLAVGKVKLVFDSSDAVNKSGWKKYIDAVNKIVVSNTGQLKWEYAGRGFFTVNTSGAKGIVGFAANKKHQLDDWSLQTNNPFAVIFISSMEKDKGLDKAKRILVTTIARAKNTGMELNDDTTHLLKTGQAPILLELVQVTLQTKRKGRMNVYALDHGGNRNGQTVPVSNGRILLDGKKYKTIYYEIVYE